MPSKTRESELSTRSNAVPSSGDALIGRGFWRSAIILLPTCLYLVLALDRIWVTEDAFITFRSVETFWNGGGPNFNDGIRVESFSHPLWFMILLVLRIAGSDMLPPLSAGLGICLSIGGLACALRAGYLRFRGLSNLFPLGGLIVLSLPPFWDFASSGLETGLTFGWIGAATLLITSLVAKGKVPSIEAFVLIGLGPLIRIDLVVIMAPLLVVALLGGRQDQWSLRSVFVGVATAAVPSITWQVFRMGYYGLVVPTTYLAKEGFESRWDQGLIYLSDTYSVYLLFPVLLVGLLLVLLSLLANSARGASGVVIALSIGGILHTALVCKAGGDFMHGRLLLPGLFALASALAVVSLPSAPVLSFTCRLGFIMWSAWTILMARPSYGEGISSGGIADERQWYVARGRVSRPVKVNDYSFHSFHRVGLALKLLAEQKKANVFYWAHIGIAVAALPPHIVVIDPLTLNDAVGAHVALEARGRPGHEKIARAAWFTARYPAGTGMVIRNQMGGSFKQPEPEEAVRAARMVLETTVVREIVEATTSPMTTGLFIRNLGRAWRLTTLRFPNDPVEALAVLSKGDRPNN